MCEGRGNGSAGLSKRSPASSAPGIPNFFSLDLFLGSFLLERLIWSRSTFPLTHKMIMSVILELAIHLSFTFVVAMVISAVVIARVELSRPEFAPAALRPATLVGSSQAGVGFLVVWVLRSVTIWIVLVVGSALLLGLGLLCEAVLGAALF